MIMMKNFWKKLKKFINMKILTIHVLFMIVVRQKLK